MKYSDLLDYAAHACGIPKEKLVIKGACYKENDEVLASFTIYCNEGVIVFNEKTES